MKTFFLFSLGTFLLTAPALTQAADFENTPKLVVRGDATLLEPSDQMEVTLGIITSGKKAADALNENKERSQRVIASLKALGLKESEYQTGRFYMQPVYEKNSEEESKRNHRKISQYETISGIRIKTQKMALSDKIIEAAIEAGANELNQVRFSLSNADSYHEEAIKAAAGNALSNASALAAAAGVKIKRVLTLSVDHWQQQPMTALLSKNRESEEAANQETTANMLEPGNTEIHASVNATFEIE